jgi:20S proteasome subunit beta 7
MDGAETLHLVIPSFFFFFFSCHVKMNFFVVARFVPPFTVFAERFLILWFGICSLYDNMWDDGNSFGPKEVHSYLTRVMYNRRNKFDPLWNSLVLGGVKNGQKYLGMVDITDHFISCFAASYVHLRILLRRVIVILIQVSMIGVNFEDNHVATGFGNHLARPLLRDEWHENLSFEDGVKLLEKCMRVLLYRDRSAINKLQVCCFLI